MTLKFSTRLQSYTDSLPKVEFEAHSLDEALQKSYEMFPDLRAALTVNGRFNPFVKVFLNNAEVPRENWKTISLQLIDEVYLVGAIAGG